MGEPVDTDWKEKFQEAKTHLFELNDSKDPYSLGKAMLYLAVVFLPLLAEFTQEHQMGSQIGVMKTLNKLQNLRTRIQDDFNVFANHNILTDPTSTPAQKEDQTAKEEKAANDAIDAWNEMKTELDADETSKIFSHQSAENIRTQFVGGGSDTETVFQGAIKKENSQEDNAKSLKGKWQDQWFPGSNDGPKTDLGPVTSSLTSVGTQLSGQSAEVQSRLKFYEADLEQYQGIYHAGMASSVDLEKTINASMRAG